MDVEKPNALQLLMQTYSAVDASDDSDDDAPEVIPPELVEPPTARPTSTSYREPKVDPALSSSSSSEPETDDDDTRHPAQSVEDQPESDDDTDCRDRTRKSASGHSAIAARGNTASQFADLPPVERLHVTLPSDYPAQKIGHIRSIIGTLVTVESDEGTPALDIGSVLLLAYNMPLGVVFDVFGPVTRACYAVRFNTIDEIQQVGVVVDEPVFFAPARTDMTNFVFTERLRAEKGSDASWENDTEPPAEHVDYSDDEAESSARRAGARGKRDRRGVVRSQPPASTNNV